MDRGIESMAASGYAAVMVAFAIGVYDRSKPLVIDPVIESSTYLGGSGDDQVIYASGKVSAGNTTSVEFPDSSPARMGWDVFYRAGSSTQIFGGSGDDILTSVMPTSFGPVLLGYTNSTDLPTSAQSVQPNYAGGASDGFFIYLWTSQLFASAAPEISYFGTSGEDRITGGTASVDTCAFTGWTTGQGLAGWQSLPQDGPGRRADGFFVSCRAEFGPNPANPSAEMAQLLLYGVRIFGTSGDDRPTGIATDSFHSGAYFISGETNSPDFPGLTGASTAPAGSSDAFIARYSPAVGPLANYYATSGSPLSGLLYGGSGSDSGAGIAVLSNGSVAIAGTTTSTDLPLVNPSQPAYGGGASDAFAAIFSPDLSQMLYKTYWGGSSAEQVTAVASDQGGGWYIGGWTSSPDFPVSNAVQPAFGGGPDDGLLVHYDPAGNIHESTFLGGSGSDHMLGLTSTNVFQVALTGQTTSPDFPAVAPQQTALRGSSDAFIAVIAANLIGAPHVTGSAGLRALAALATSSGMFTLTTSDPSSVLLSATFADRGSASIVLSPATGYSALFISGQNNYYVDCLANGARADITATATGYLSANGARGLRSAIRLCIFWLAVMAEASATTPALPTSVPGAEPPDPHVESVCNQPEQPERWKLRVCGIGRESRSRASAGLRPYRGGDLGIKRSSERTRDIRLRVSVLSSCLPRPRLDDYPVTGGQHRHCLFLALAPTRTVRTTAACRGRPIHHSGGDVYPRRLPIPVLFSLQRNPAREHDHYSPQR